MDKILTDTCVVRNSCTLGDRTQLIWIEIINHSNGDIDLNVRPARNYGKDNVYLFKIHYIKK